ncbi:MAG TPA: hypothetical protein VN578_09830 [Candidatus Binatia bacterium]|jgi:hypothetical protein|nr:hypothetical protein [Candidatus Binatia bacterium]
MKSYLDNLRPFEKRVVVAGAALFFVVFNVVFVRPYFSEWGTVQDRMWQAQRKLKLYNAEIADMPKYQRLVAELQAGGGSAVPAEDQAHNFSVTVQSQAAASNVHITQTSRITTHTNNQTFLEQSQTISIQSGEQQLVDFLYNLGASNSLIRVRALNLGPEPAHHELAGSITLMASYQKNAPAKTAAPAASAKPTGPVVTSKPGPTTTTQSPPQKKPGVIQPLPYIPGKEPSTAKTP